MYKFLEDLDPLIQFGKFESGLKRISIPEGEYLWLCDRHIAEYNI